MRVMADLEKTVKIIFEGEDKALINAVSGVSGKFDSLSMVVGQVTEPLARVADSVLKVDAALAALVIGGLALAVKESSSFNQQFALISTSVDATGDDLSRYRQQILDYSTTSTRSISDINSALYTAAQAGIKWGDSLEFIGKAEELAVANNANLNTTVDLLTGTMNAYGFTIKDVAHVNDVLFTSTLIGKQTIDSLGQSMGQVVGIAANFGVSFESLSAAIATLTAKGMETSEAITGVKGVITTMVQPSNEAAKSAQAMGLTFGASTLQARGFAGMLADVMAATGGSKDKMALLFGEVRALNGAMQLTGDGMKFFNNALNEINNSTGASEAAYKKMSATFINQGQMVINTAKTLLIEVGTAIEPIAAGVAGAFADLLKGVKIGVDAGAFDPLFNYLAEAGRQLSVWFSGVAAALPKALEGLDFGRLIKSLQDLWAAFGQYLGNLDLTNVEDLHRFIQGLIDGIAGLIEVTAGMVEGFRPLFSAIADFLKGLAHSDSESQKMVGTLLALSKAVEAFGLGLVAVTKAVQEADISITGTFGTIAGGAQVMWNGLQILFNGIGMAIILIGKSFLEFLNMLSGGHLSKFSESFRNMQAVVEESGLKLRESFVQNGLDAGRGLDRVVEGLSGLASQSSETNRAVSNAGKTIQAAGSHTEAFGKSAEEAAGKVVTLGREVEKIPEKKETSLAVKADALSLKNTEDTIYEKFGGSVMKIKTELDGTTTIENVTKLNEAFPSKKKVEVEPDITQTAVAEIKAKSEIIQKSIEWKAKIDIAQIESATKMMEEAFKSVNVTVESTGKTMTDLAGTYATLVAGGKGGTYFLEQMIEQESRRRDEALEMQRDLVGAQVENLNARTEAMRSGQAMIEIDGKGLQPHLESFMFEILKAIQVRANAEGAQYLVGI